MRYLPKNIARRLRGLPQWAAIGAPESPDLVRVQLAAGRMLFEVTHNHVIAALKPLTLALGLDGPLRRAIDEDPAPRLIFVDQHSGRRIAWLQLAPVRTLASGTADIALFHIARHRHRCVRWPYRAWNGWMQARAAAGNLNPVNFAMSPRSQQHIMLFYIRPRPVVLVSVETATHRNIFPMDLIGPLWPDLFTLGLRNTSQSVESMKIARRLAISDIAAADVNIAHGLGAHHKHLPTDWCGLPFAIERSPHFSLPVPAIALRVREIEILDFDVVGSHTFFICRPVSSREMRPGLALCHTSGLYQHFKSRQGQPLTPA
jgi:flavin reductase (DIM6/NTAB) family NADH-FMN oxidoreductase RutF